MKTRLELLREKMDADGYVAASEYLGQKWQGRISVAAIEASEREFAADVLAKYKANSLILRLAVQQV